MANRPVEQSGTLSALIIVMANSIVGFLTAAGILSWDSGVQIAFNTMVVSVVNVGAVLIPMLIWLRKSTTSVSDPHDTDGTPMTRPDGSPVLKSAERKKQQARSLILEDDLPLPSQSTLGGRNSRQL